MSKTLILIILSVLVSLFVQGQTGGKEITTKGYKYRFNGKKIKPNKMLEIMKSNPEAYAIMKKANTNYDIGTVFTTVGGLCISWSLAVSIINGNPLGKSLGKPPLTLLKVGVGALFIATAFNVGYNSNAKTAIKIYNSGLNKMGHNKLKIHMGLTPDGIGLICRL